MGFYSLLRPIIYRLQPEQAHALSVGLLRLAGMLPPVGAGLRSVFRSFGPAHPVRAFGLDFANPLGLAAGYDKDGLAWRGLACLGFGHLELGTVTPKPQPGNPKPRVFRLVEDQAVINRMGFPGLGARFLAGRLGGKRPRGLVIGVNIGKNKDTPDEEAARDYVSLVETFAPLADYLAVNVSSPNTPGLRKLQERGALEKILAPVDAARSRLGRRVPVLVKLAPDLDDAGLDGALEAALGCGMDGIIAANTSVRRDGLRSPSAGETGGLSGAPLAALSQEFLAKVVRRLDGRLPVIASGGVMDAAGARARLDAGAALVQLYTGLIYAGPGLVKDILDSRRVGLAGDFANYQIGDAMHCQPVRAAEALKNPARGAFQIGVAGVVLDGHEGRAKQAADKTLPILGQSEGEREPLHGGKVIFRRGVDTGRSGAGLGGWQTRQRGPQRGVAAAVADKGQPAVRFEHAAELGPRRFGFKPVQRLAHRQ